MVRLSPPDRSGPGRLPRRPSPILIRDRLRPRIFGRLRGWIRDAFGNSNPVAKPPTPAPTKKGQSVANTSPAGAAAAPKAQPAHRSTVQMLPGRLEPLIPEVIQQEVRFQRAGGEGQEVTIGWEHGDPPLHVTLDHPSIQPLHAKMTFQKGNWMIESLAQNDPVEINGTPVPPSAGPYLLAAGDQVRIGEALFRFFLP